MGGSGSGRHWHYNTRATTADYRGLDVRKIHRAGLLRPGLGGTSTWSRGDRVAAQIGFTVEGDGDQAEALCLAYRVDGEPVDLRVSLSWTPCHYGGVRPWLLCPTCVRRVAIIYGGRLFVCRHCRGLAYPSTREDRMSRSMTKAHRIRDRLGSPRGMSDPFPKKPKGMHWRTYWRLCHEAHDAEITALEGMNERLGRLLSGMNARR